MLKLMLMEDDRILLELPLSARGWDRDELRMELDALDRDMDRVSGLFRALSNAGRLRMMRALLDELDRPLAFTELMNGLGMNPKVVWDSTRRLRQIGFIEKDEEGRYCPTREGEAQFLLVSVAVRRLLQILEQL